MFDLGTGKSVGLGFTEIVGQQELKEALRVVAVNEALDGLLIRGEKGTAKSTAVRALAELLPAQRVVAGCPYGCPPEGGLQCASCRERADPETTERPVPVVTLPLGATRDRVVGTLSVADALDGEQTFDPGLLARANRGILYVDEVNLLDDHLVDVLLDVAASGVNRVERDGVSVTHPARFALIGTMNPEEGELRPQLRDRFALQATVTACEAIEDRVTIIDRAIGQAGDSHSENEQLRDRLVQARDRMEDVALPGSAAQQIATLCRESGVEGHRGDIATARAAMALAALDGRATVTDSDVLRAAELALPHRLQSRPFGETPDAEEFIEEQFDGEKDNTDDAGDGDRTDDADDGDDTDTDGSEQRNTPDTTESGGDDTEPATATDDETSGSQRETTAGSEAGGSKETSDGADDEKTPIVPGSAPAGVGTARAPELSVPDAVDTAISDDGTRGPTTPHADAEGARVRTERSDAAQPHRIDAAASVRTAANRGASTVESRDLRHSVRRGESSTLVVFVVDASASMRPAMRAAKGTVLELLKDAYQHRDAVAFVAVAGEGADVVLPPTDSVTLAARHLKELPTGDRTPLPDGLETASELLERADPAVGLAVVVTDGRANAADGSPTEQTRTAAARLAETASHTLVVDADENRAGLTETIAEITDGNRVPLDALSAERVDALTTPLERFTN